MDSAQDLPEAVRNSTVLTGNNLGRLGNLEELPTTIKAPVFLSAIRSTPSRRGSPGISRLFFINSLLLFEYFNYLNVTVLFYY